MTKEIVKAPDSLSVWTSNIKQMMKLQPRFAAVLLEYVEKHGHDFSHEEMSTPTGKWIEGLAAAPFFQEDADPKISWDRRDRNTPVFFQYGIGTPPYLFKAIRALPKEALALIVVEPSVALVAYVLHMTHVYTAMPPGATLVFISEPTEVQESLKMIKGDDQEEIPLDLLARALREEALSASLQIQGLFTAGMSKTNIHPGEESAFGMKLTEIAHNIREWVLVSLNYLGNSSHDTMLGLRQMSLMSPWMVYGYQFNTLMESFRGRPFVIVNAGPSLEKNFEQLRGLSEKCVIIATDAVLKKMLTAGIRPHIVCALERGIGTYTLLFKDSVREFPEECSKILLISQAVSTPRLFGTWPGPKIIVGKGEVPVDQWFVEGALHSRAIPSGTSVSHMSLGVAEELGASSVALIGQDLAFAPDGSSHSGGIFTGKTLDAQKKGADPKRQLHTIPSVDGGYVETTDIWLSFLRLLETRIATVDFPVYDCTEGGALINGAIIETFANYIAEHVDKCEPIAETPAELVSRVGLIADRRAKFDEVSQYFTKASDDIDTAADIIDQIHDSISKVSAPALTPKMRISYAGKTATLLDKLHHLNPMFGFIAQSYLYLSTTEIAVTRFLDSVEMVDRWVAVHKEIIEAHVTVLSFVKTWFDYARAVLEYYVEHELRIDPIEPDKSLALFREIRDTLGDGEDQVALRCAMDSLFTFEDIERDEWPGEEMWQCAMFLLNEGRAQEATSLMQLVEKLFDGREMPTETILAFLKDYGRVLITPDLIHMPNYSYARVIINNALEMAPDDEEIQALKEEMAEREQSLLADYAVYMGSYKRETLVKWYAARAKAQEAFEAGRVMESFRMIWDAVRDHGRTVPGVSATHLNWLVRQMEKFLDADNSEIKETIDYILDGMAAEPGVMLDVPVSYTLPFMRALAAHGAEIEIPEVETADAPAEQGEEIHA